MNRFFSLVFIFGLLMFSATATAEIISYECDNDGDGAIDCVMQNWQEVGEDYSMDIVGNQFWGPGHMNGSFTTDTPVDPNINVFNFVDNETGYAWTAYQVNVTMNHPFTLSNAVALSPSNWTSTITPVTPVGSNYVGTVNYVSGTPVPDLGTFGFQYKISFSGYTSYSYCQEMIPVPVPEPGTLVLLACGAIGLLVARRRFAR
jgi:hypothetical protein